MKTVTRTSVLLAVAVAWFTLSPAQAIGQTTGPRYRNPRVAAHPDARSRVNSRTTAQTAPEVIGPETIAAPPGEGPFPFEGDPAMWDGYTDDGGCYDGSCGIGRRGAWYYSLDYLLIRPHLSQGVAEVRSTQVTQQGGTPAENFTNSIDESITYNFDYSSSFRTAIGYRLLDCAGDIQFSYWRLTGEAQVADGPASLEGELLGIAGQLDMDADEGQFFAANTGIAANIYDIDFSKSLSFGGLQEPYDCNYCPRWSLRWLAGIRIGDVSRFNNNALTEPNGDVDSFGRIDARFVGGGPRVGVQGRRYFGPCGKWSVFAKGSQALLVGDYDTNRVRTTPGIGTQQPTQIVTQIDSSSRVIPVTDIELGATWQAAPYAFFTAGWMWQAWWDLGQGENIQNSNFGPLDSSNILGFDGLFLRGELMF